MSKHLHQIALFEQLADSQRILLAGAGGGFDIFSGIPLYFNLVAQGKEVVLANFSFTWLEETTAKEVFPFCYEIKGSDQDLSQRNYFPEKYLKLFLALQGQIPHIYAFNRTGVNPLKAAYRHLIDLHQIDTVILVDGGTDSLMFGDEEGLGTPQEDICSMAAVYRTGIKKQFLVSLGFGIDHFHGVSHFHFLENVASLAQDGGYLGLFQMTKEMPEAQQYLEAIRFANTKMPGMESIVSNSIASALEGHYGDQHATLRTRGSELWINPLMTIFWCFDLRKVIQKNYYFDLIRNTNTIGELNGQLAQYRSQLKAYRPKRQLPI